jgi:hypothetical protein
VTDDDNKITLTEQDVSEITADVFATDLDPLDMELGKSYYAGTLAIFEGRLILRKPSDYALLDADTID